ncbi:MAG: DUF3048 domain-containing protein [Acidimicrobiaceae bacterium]|nr:DUF3048 domain-containing protein [Acidimicrobiaceae bacterium]MDE0607100.1 DUF3048 domain-containing protein [Acidimicrobiaceae bacterium]
MATTSRVLSLIIVCCVAVSVLAAPALSQEDPRILREEQAHLREQESRRDELTAFIAAQEAALGELNNEILDLANAISTDNTRLALLADKFERTVDERREPAATRIEIAVISFRQGDPRQSGLIDEIRSLDGNTTVPRQRVLYQSVVDDATRRLNEIDARLQGLTDQLTQTRQLLSASQDQFEQRQARQRQLRDEIDAAEAELENTLVAIQNTLIRIDKEQSRQISAVLTGLDATSHVDRPALVVKIDNVPAAMPQAGVNQADVVFVEEVEFATRLAAVFHSTAPEEVGPVRSMRTGDFDLLAQLNSPLFANSGGNRGARAALAQSTLVDIGVGAAPQLYYRVSSRRVPHNLFTNTGNLWSVGSGYSGTGLPSPMFVFRGPDEPINSTAVPASSIDIDYGHTEVSYAWNGSGWDRTQDGRPMFDNRGIRTSPATVIVQFTRYGQSAADSRSPEAIAVGAGRALVFTDGHVVEATWSRQRAADVTVYSDNQGRRISILPGRTWVELPRSNSTSYS